ncbi:HEAT repeat domain-containing protein [Methanoregula sp.]|uniref:HEAT repeat domain-containing protein n=1 Tax=Methanoregula sp. TaxID=2052170 RepID=UPI002CB35963|nr:HEAT repeat domain-containing protein [Methanoregula sp.]HVP95717.1 HEAT repeat domain-containing protein [Methanoregula sp.]
MEEKEARSGGMAWGTYQDKDEAALQLFRGPLFAYLVSGLDAENKWVRIKAAAMLGSLGDPGAARYLKPLAVDADTDLRTISRRSLSMLYPGRDFSVFGGSDACGGCMIRFIAEEALAHQKKAQQELQGVPERNPGAAEGPLPGPGNF